jgi:hypothetical protein
MLTLSPPNNTHTHTSHLPAAPVHPLYSAHHIKPTLRLQVQANLRCIREGDPVPTVV